MAAPFSGLLTAADLSFEPDDGLRRELHDGVVQVVPPPSDRLSWAVLAAYRALYRDAPRDVRVLVTLDRVTKPAIHAEQGIPYFWRIEDGPRLQTYRLDPAAGSYELVTDLAPGETGDAAAPWVVRVDMTELAS